MYKRHEIFDGSFWSVIEDKRGIYYTAEEGPDVVFNDNPLEAPQYCTREVPPEVEENQYLTWDDGWVINDIVPVVLTPEQKLEGLDDNEIDDVGSEIYQHYKNSSKKKTKKSE